MLTCPKTSNIHTYKNKEWFTGELQVSESYQKTSGFQPEKNVNAEIVLSPYDKTYGTTFVEMAFTQASR